MARFLTILVLALVCIGGASFTCDESFRGNNNRWYRGCQNITVTGKACKPWPARKNQWSTETYLDGNYCRNPNPSNRKSVWCFTDDAKKEWEYCPTCQGQEYGGDLSTTINGRRCKGNQKCGNEWGKDIRPWCPVGKPKDGSNDGMYWDYCDVPYPRNLNCSVDGSFVGRNGCCSEDPRGWGSNYEWVRPLFGCGKKNLNSDDCGIKKCTKCNGPARPQCVESGCPNETAYVEIYPTVNSGVCVEFKAASTEGCQTVCVPQSSDAGMRSSTCTKWCDRKITAFDPKNQSRIKTTCRLYKQTKCHKVDCEEDSTFRQFRFDKESCHGISRNECQRRCQRKFCEEWDEGVCTKMKLVVCQEKKYTYALDFQGKSPANLTKDDYLAYSVSSASEVCAHSLQSL